MVVLGLLGIMLFLMWIYVVVEVIATDPRAVRTLPKVVWLLVVVVLPFLGSVLWLALGRPEGAPIAVPKPPAAGSTRRSRPARTRKRVVGPEDSPEFMSQLERRRKGEQDPPDSS